MAKDESVGFAVVGLGSIAQNHVLPSFANSKKANLVAVVSRDKEKAERLAAKFNADFHYTNSDYDACLRNPEVNAIYVATPPGTHPEFTIRAAAAHKHVLCEKPLSATAQEAMQMVKACEQNRVLLMTAYRKYYEPSTLFLKSLIQSGQLGHIDMIHTSFSELYDSKTSPPWLLDPNLSGGGPLMDLGVYCVSTSRWLVNEQPNQATAYSWRHDPAKFRDVEEGISFRLHFPGGLIVQGASTYSASMSSFIFVQGTKGSALLSPAYPFEYERQVTVQIGGSFTTRKFPVMDEFAPELDAFSTALQQWRGIEASGREGYRDMIIVGAIYESARLQHPVPIKY